MFKSNVRGRRGEKGRGRTVSFRRYSIVLKEHGSGVG